MGIAASLVSKAEDALKEDFKGNDKLMKNAEMR